MNRSTILHWGAVGQNVFGPSVVQHFLFFSEPKRPLDKSLTYYLTICQIRVSLSRSSTGVCNTHFFFVFYLSLL